MTRDQNQLVQRYAELSDLQSLIADDGALDHVIRTLAQTIAGFHRTAGGSTTLWDGTPARAGFAVALRTPVFVAVKLHVGDIASFLAAHIGDMVRNTLVPGTWVDPAPGGGEMLLCTRVWGTRPEADRFAIEQGQRFIWDLARCRAVPVGTSTGIAMPLRMPCSNA